MNSETGALLCTWNYNGQGIEYQLLAGPSFILAFSIGGIVLGALADRFNRCETLLLGSFREEDLIVTLVFNWLCWHSTHHRHIHTLNRVVLIQIPHQYE